MVPRSSRTGPAGAKSEDRKLLGAWYTPEELVETIVDHAVTDRFLAARSAGNHALRVLDPACGDGRFLAAVASRSARSALPCVLVGFDIDQQAVEAARSNVPGARIEHADALGHDFGDERFDLVIGNPPFLSQMAAATSRGGTSSRSGGPYADAAVEFLALAGELVDGDGGRVAFVLPQSILGARDARHVRASFDERADLIWSWWTGRRQFDAQVHTCALAFQFRAENPRLRRDFGDPVLANRDANVELGNWSFVVTSRQAIPDVPKLDSSGQIGDRANLNANFRDEYYGMIPAVGDHDSGPPLVSSGLIDPAQSLWGRRSVTFAKRRFDAPRIEVSLLDAKMQRWATKRLVPKVLVANQTSIIEAVCDPLGEWLPAVPVIGIYPRSDDVGRPPATVSWEIAAVLTSPVASALVWHGGAGTGMSATTVRLGPAALGSVPWPSGDLDPAVAAVRDGDVRRCGLAMLDAYGIDDHKTRAELFEWWSEALERIERRSGNSV